MAQEALLMTQPVFHLLYFWATCLALEGEVVAEEGVLHLSVMTVYYLVVVTTVVFEFVVVDVADDLFVVREEGAAFLHLSEGARRICFVWEYTA